MDSSESGKVMWARIKGKTENALMKMLPGKEFNFRPALMRPVLDQKNFCGYNKWMHKMLYPILRFVFPACSIQEIAQAMINRRIWVQKSVALVERGGERAFQGRTTPARIRRGFADLVEHLYRELSFPAGRGLKAPLANLSVTNFFAGAKRFYSRAAMRARR